MTKRISVVFLLACASVVGVPRAALAQEPAARHGVAIHGGLVSLDLAGTGLYAGGAARVTRALTPSLGLEAGAFFTRYDSAPDATSFIVPEVQLQYHWRIGPATGYAGGGPGVAWSRRHGANDASLSLSAAGGVRAPLSDRLGVVAELRMRGVTRSFSGSTAEVMGGVSWWLGPVPPGTD